MKLNVSEDHIVSAIEAYLKMMGMIDDDAAVLAVKRNRDNSFEIEVETE